MKYWFYSEGNILGPYEPADMLALPTFAEESLVCAETATGDSPGDWRPAMQVEEIGAIIRAGSGRSITAGVSSGGYGYGGGADSQANYFDDKTGGANYGELLDTLDDILGSSREGEPGAAAGPKEADYDLAQNLDIRLSHIQEELEAARWEKNLLLEKMRIKETEEKKTREHIRELEARLSGTAASDDGFKGAAQDGNAPETGQSDEDARKIEGMKLEELALNGGAVSGADAVKPGFENGPKVLKSIKSSAEIKSESVPGVPAAASEDSGLTSRKFKSLGHAQPASYAYGSHYDKPLPGPEAAPKDAFKDKEVLEPLPQQAGGVVYNFTVVTSQQPETSQRFKIEPHQELPAPQFQPEAAAAAPDTRQPQPDKAPAYDFGAPAQQAQAAPAGPEPVRGFYSQVQGAPSASTFSPSDHGAPQAFQEKRTPAATAATAEPADLQRAAAAPSATKGKPEAAAANQPRRKGGKMAFILILVVFGSIAAGGLGYFFMGEGVSFSEFSMLNLGGKKKAAGMTSQLEATTEAPAPKEEPVQVQQKIVPAPEKPVNDITLKALKIVKAYKLSGGRGTIESWFSNSFLPGSTRGANEEWTATPLHGDILVVQYRLLRSKQDPMVYQFEVDAAKQDIVRGMNNSAIELLNLSSKEKTVSSAAVRKPSAPAVKRAVKKPSRPKGIPLRPLPAAPRAAAKGEDEPTGFETQAEGSEQVKYLKAQESDEELF